MSVKIGLDVGNGFITATMIKNDGGVPKREDVFDCNRDGTIPSIIVARKNFDISMINNRRQNDILCGIEAEEALEGNDYNKTSRPIKTIMIECENNDFSDIVKTNVPGNNATQIATAGDLIKILFEYIRAEIEKGLEQNDESIEIDSIGVGYPNNYSYNATRYMNKLENIISDVFHIESNKIHIMPEAYYAGLLLNNMGILSEEEVGMIVDIGAGTTDIAIVKAGEVGDMVLGGSLAFGGNNVDAILEQHIPQLINAKPKDMIEYKNFLFGIDGTQTTLINNWLPPTCANWGIFKNRFFGDRTEYNGQVNRVANNIASIIRSNQERINIGSQDSFKVVFAGGSCRLPDIKTCIENKLREVICEIYEREINIETIILEDYRIDGETQTEAEKRNIDNETFMSYAVALNLESSSSGTETHASEVAATTTEHEEQAQQVNEGALTVCSCIRPVECGAPYILALLVKRQGQDNESGEKCFYKLTTLDSRPNRYTVVSQGRYVTLDDGRYASFFKGIADNIYYLFPNEGNLPDSEAGSKAQMGGNEYSVYDLRNNNGVTEVVPDIGHRYEVYEIIYRVIKDGFKPKYMDGKAVVEIENSDSWNEITDSAQATNNADFVYDVEFTYDYSGARSQNDKIVVKYKGYNLNSITANPRVGQRAGQNR